MSLKCRAKEFEFIDLVVSNLYPFEATIAKEGVELAEAIENIDIGGPSMIRAAAKITAMSPSLLTQSSIPTSLRNLTQMTVAFSEETRFQLAKAAFLHTAITTHRFHVTSPIWIPPTPTFQMCSTSGTKAPQSLRYGENPHQRATFYRTHASPEPCAAWANQLSGQPLRSITSSIWSGNRNR